MKWHEFKHQRECASASEARPCWSVVKTLCGAVGVRALPFVVVAVVGLLALPLVASAADISFSTSSNYSGRQQIVIDSAWLGADADAAVRVKIVDATNGVTYLTAAAGEKEVAWNPPLTGAYTLTLQKQVGDAWESTDYTRQLTVDGITTATADDIELNLLAPGEAVAEDTFVDIAVGTRTNAVMHPIVYSSEWTAGADGVKIYRNGELVFTGSGEGTLDWSPETNGTYVLTHRSFVGTAATGEDLIATFFVTGLANVEKVSARQRYPWNGMVDIAFTITGEAGTAYQVSFAAKDMAGGTNLVMKTVMSESGGLIEAALPPGTYRAVWNAGADLPDGFRAERVAITVEAK